MIQSILMNLIPSRKDISKIRLIFRTELSRIVKESCQLYNTFQLRKLTYPGGKASHIP